LDGWLVGWLVGWFVLSATNWAALNLQSNHMPPPHHRHAQVRFSTKSFGRDAAQVAARALKNVAHCLEHADMSDVIAGRAVSSGLVSGGGGAVSQWSWQ